MTVRRMFETVTLVAALSVSSQALSLGALTTAVMNDEVETVSRLITDPSVDVNAIDEGGAPVLVWAVYMENPEVVKLLLGAGADVGMSNREGMFPLAVAAMLGNGLLTEMLLDAGADPDQTMPNGETPLMLASRSGDTEPVRMILDRGADIDAVENLRGTSALMWAAAYQNVDVIDLLVSNGADVSMMSGTMPPGEGAYLAETARSRIRDFYFNTGQGGASLEDELALEGGPEVRASREELLGRLPRELIEEFEREAAQPDEEGISAVGSKQWGGLTALHFAVREGSLPAVQALLKAGADINQLSEYGWTPLLVATQNRYYQLGRYLLENGADPNIANAGGWNPLYIATDNRNIEGGSYPTRKPDMNHLDYIRLLLEAGADPNRRMASSTETRNVFVQSWLREAGATPFLRAAQSSDIELMKLLLEYGADPHTPTLAGVTPLMVASGIGWVGGVTYEWSEEANRETIQMLLDLGADPNAREVVDGRTALMGAAFKGRNYAVQMLVDAGADLAARDIGSRDTLHNLAGVTWQAVDYADGLVRVGVQSSIIHAETGALIRKLMRERGMDVPPEGRSLDSLCIVAICQ